MTLQPHGPGEPPCGQVRQPFSQICGSGASFGAQHVNVGPLHDVSGKQQTAGRRSPQVMSVPMSAPSVPAGQSAGIW